MQILESFVPKKKLSFYNPVFFRFTALKNKKSVVTANKAVIAKYGNEIFGEAKKNLTRIEAALEDLKGVEKEYQRLSKEFETLREITGKFKSVVLSIISQINSVFTADGVNATQYCGVLKLENTSYTILPKIRSGVHFPYLSKRAILTL